MAMRASLSWTQWRSSSLRFIGLTGTTTAPARRMA